VTRCPQCNAPLVDDVESCIFCGTLTEAGRRVRSERATQQKLEAQLAQQRASMTAQSEQSRATQEIARAGTRAILWSVLGLLACCLPIGPIVGLVMSRGAAQLAKKHGLDSSRATLGLAVSASCLLICVGMWIFIVVLGVKESNHKAELLSVVEAGAGKPALSAPTACALAELELMETKFGDFSYANHDFHCSSDLTLKGDDARLLGSYFMKESKRVPVVACFHKTARWSVQQLRSNDACNAPPEGEHASDPNVPAEELEKLR
jgi:hypothetical protein